MAAIIIDGKAAAARYGRYSQDVGGLAARGIRPGLAVVLVGEDPASEVYVARRPGSGKRASSFEHRLPIDRRKPHCSALAAPNNDDAVHRILVQLRFRRRSTPRRARSIDPAKDVDGFHPSMSAGCDGQPGLVPCTPLGA